VPKASTTKLIVLDRDGVINEDLLGYVTRKEEFKPIEGSLEAIKKLNTAGFTVVVATNQACISKKIIATKQLEAVHEHMSSLVQETGGKIEYIAFCPHSPDDNCSCRKPETGLLVEIEERIGSSLKNSFFIGDKESDLLCATRHGCIPLLVKTGYGTKTLTSKHCPPKERCFKDLMDAVSYVLES
jgi:D-glycero-D-manno-heptose 1,7-bisphosphate phosphatase